DSTAVAAIARGQLGAGLDTFTLGFDVASFDERDHAAQVARVLGTRHHVLTITPALFLDGLRTLAPLLDEPIADPSLIPTYLLATQPRPHAREGGAGRRGQRRALRRLSHLPGRPAGRALPAPPRTTPPAPRFGQPAPRRIARERDPELSAEAVSRARRGADGG